MESRNLENIKIMEYYDKKKKYNMNVFIYIPSGNINKMKIIFVMSGCLRDALNYLKGWISYAEENRYILIAPEFDRRHYSLADHEYGNVIEVEYDFSSQDIYVPYMKYDNNIKNEEEWTFQNIDEIYLKFIEKYQMNNIGYSIFGHSSGSQFVHRFAILGDSQYCNKYICANAGLYTFYDTTKDYPYGIRNLEKYRKRIEVNLQKSVYILAGEKDTESSLLNMLPEDKKQGINRYERAQNFFQVAKDYAKQNSIKFNWKFISMPNVGHYSKDVIPFTINIINNM